MEEDPFNKGFVKHPPRDGVDLENQPDLMVHAEDILVSELPHAESLALVTRDNQFTEKGNPVYAIESIILCHEAGYYPPLKMLDWLVDSLKDWHQNNGLKSMDNAMGLSKKGQSGPFKELVRQEWIENLMVEFFQLKQVFGLKNTEVSEMIATRLEDTEWNFSGHKFRPLSADTIKKRYEETGAKHFKQFTEDTGKGLHSNKTKEDKRAILKKYPDHAYMHLPEVAKYK